MKIEIIHDGDDFLRVDRALIETRADFEKFAEALFVAAEALWPTPDESASEIETLPPFLPRAAQPAPTIAAGDKQSRNARILHMVDVEKRKHADVARSFGLGLKAVENILYRQRRARRA